jgi:hypothetical protein
MTRRQWLVVTVGVVLVAAIAAIAAWRPWVSREPTPPIALGRDGASEPIDQGAKAGDASITIHFEELPAEVREELRKLLSQVISEGLGKAAEEFVKELGAQDDIDAEALGSIDKFFDRPHRQDDCFTIWLLRPGAAGPPQTVVAGQSGKAWLRFTRVAAPVAKPLAILQRVRISAGEITQAEIYMEHDAEKGWKPVPAKERRLVQQ